MLIQIKDLTDSAPLLNLVSREEINLINQSCEPTRPLEWRLVEYKDQSSQTEEILSIVNKKQLFLEYHPIEDWSIERGDARKTNWRLVNSVEKCGNPNTTKSDYSSKENKNRI